MPDKMKGETEVLLSYFKTLSTDLVKSKSEWDHSLQNLLPDNRAHQSGGRFLPRPLVDLPRKKQMKNGLKEKTKILTSSVRDGFIYTDSRAPLSVVKLS